MSRGSLTLVVLVLAMGVGRSSIAMADNSTKNGKDLFLQGRAAFDEGKYDLARSYFEQSQAIDPAVGTLLNLAVCEERLSRLTAALAHLNAALAKADPTDGRRQLITGRLVELEKRTPRLTIRLAAPLASDVTISLDGTSIDHSALGTAMRVDPGSHALKCAAPSGARCAQEVAVREGEDAVADLIVTEPVAAPAPMPAPAPAPHPPEVTNRSSNVVPYVIGGIGVASLAAGLITAMAVINRKATVSEHCDASGGCDQQGLDAARSGKTLDVISTVTTLVGVAGIGTSAYLLLSPSGAKGPTVSWAISGSF
jgi:hypothetical protein